MLGWSCYCAARQHPAPCSIYLLHSAVIFMYLYAEMHNILTACDILGGASVSIFNYVYLSGEMIGGNTWISWRMLKIERV